MVQFISILIGIVFATTIIMVRLKAAKKPTNVKKIILPPVFMSTGFAMFFAPEMRVPFSDAIEAFALGAVFSILLVKTSRFHIKDNNIYLKRSKAFIFILIGLLIVRTLLKLFMEKSFNVDLQQTSALFFILAFGMILPWRVAMYVMYKRMERKLEDSTRIITT